jgi:hypothetical protein
MAFWQKSGIHKTYAYASTQKLCDSISRFIIISYACKTTQSHKATKAFQAMTSLFFTILFPAPRIFIIIFVFDSFFLGA